MEEDYISISTLNDFIFCPYSIYLHNVYMESDEGLYHATPQTQGRIAHETVDEKKGSTSKDVIFALPVYSEKYRLMGKIDVYKKEEKCLIERKYQLKQIYQGQIYQLWDCWRRMGLYGFSFLYMSLTIRSGFQIHFFSRLNNLQKLSRVQIV